jgi:hypothetical protein
MNEKKISRILAAFFLLIGVLATVNTARLHSYIRETLPRDQSQERCQDDTLGVLRGWVNARWLRDATADNRADATIVVLDRLIAGQPATPEELRRWRDTVAADNTERLRGTQQLHALPNC